MSFHPHLSEIIPEESFSLASIPEDTSRVTVVPSATSYTLTPDEIQELKEIFELVDLDGGGTISKDELATLVKTLGLQYSTVQNYISYVSPLQAGIGLIIWSHTHRSLSYIALLKYDAHVGRVG